MLRLADSLRDQTTEARPVLIQFRYQPGRRSVGEIDDVAVFNYFYLCIWHRDNLEVLFFSPSLHFLVREKTTTNHTDRDLQIYWMRERAFHPL